MEFINTYILILVFFFTIISFFLSFSFSPFLSISLSLSLSLYLYIYIYIYIYMHCLCWTFKLASLASLALWVTWKIQVMISFQDWWVVYSWFINLGNLSEVVVHYLLIKGITCLSHQNEFLMVSVLMCMVTYSARPTVHNDSYYDAWTSTLREYYASVEVFSCFNLQVRS